MPQSDFWPFGKVNPRPNSDCHDESSVLQKQLGDMEGEVKQIQTQLAAMRKNRADGSTMDQPIHVNETNFGDPSEPNPNIFGSHLKLSETTKLQEDLLLAQKMAEEERMQRESYETKLKDLESKWNNMASVGKSHSKKEERSFSDDELNSLKMQIREMKGEIEELNITVTEKNEQLQDYRIKYLQAQQQVEEQKRQLEVIGFDNKQVSDQIQIEIQKMKMQFHEKLQELAPLPDLLKGAQIQLQEAKQLQKLAEDSSQQLSNELYRVKDKLVIAVNNANQEKSEKIRALEDNRNLRIALEEKTKSVEVLGKIVDEQKFKLTRLEEKLLQEEIRYNEKAAECAKSIESLEEMKEQSSRSLNRAKERADSMRRYLQSQISELERQLIQSRAHCKASQKERDEIRQRIQIQVTNLQENFELVEIRLRTLQNQVTSLKNSYSVILADDDESTDYNKLVSSN